MAFPSPHSTAVKVVTEELRNQLRAATPRQPAPTPSALLPCLKFYQSPISVVFTVLSPLGD